MTQEITDRFFLEEIFYHLCKYKETNDINDLDHAITLSMDIAKEYQKKYPLTEIERQKYIEEIGMELNFFPSEEDFRVAYE